ncbi:MAG: hypothetical protein REI78_11245 [Pedobacter sp.]|nr:hypothetical protein [Pedobacter sp.]MDQ8053597.1 hypothetical protein [Pedobacter sp.]
MIIKLPIPFIYARHKEAKIARPLTYSDRLKTDRFVMVLLFILTVMGAIIIS